MKPWWVLLFVPLASAGTSDDPEIRDAKDDNVSSIALFGAPAADLLAIWFFDDAEGFHASILLDAPVCAEPSESIDYVISFDFQGGTAGFGATITGDPGGTDLCPANASGTSIRATGQARSASFTGATITVMLTPGIVANLGLGGPLTGVSVASKAYVAHSAAAAGWSDTDRAPDSGSITVERTAADGGAPAIQYHNVTEAVLSAAGNETQPRDGALHINWTMGPQAADLQWRANATQGGLNVTILDANGTTLFSCACEASEEAVAIAGAAGTWSVLLEFAGFAGDYHLSIAAAAPQENATEPEPTPTPTDTATASETPTHDAEVSNGTAKDNDTPLPAFVLLLALAAVALRRRL